MDEKKVSFIMCTNDDVYRKECEYYISKLNIPDGMEVEIFSISEAESMTEGYNLGMHASNAKYKVYLHQDVFLINPDFIEEFLRIFKSDSSIGMIGVVGTDHLPDDAIAWDCWNQGITKVCNGMCVMTFKLGLSECKNKLYWDSEAIDGMLLITNRDIEWREDIKRFDFYDLSQCMEFKKYGYRIVTAYQEHPWAIHDCGQSKLSDYDVLRKRFCELYGDRFVYKDNSANADRAELMKSAAKLSGSIRSMIDNGLRDDAIRILNKIEGIKSYDNLLIKLYYCALIFSEDLEQGKAFWPKYIITDSLLQRYESIRFYLMRKEYNMDSEWDIDIGFKITKTMVEIVGKTCTGDNEVLIGS